MRAILLIALLLGVTAQPQSYDEEKAQAGQGPMTRIINMLKKMNEELVAEQEADDKAHEQYKCFCSTNLKTKAHELKNNKVEDTRLTGEIDRHTGLIAKYEVEIDALKRDIQKARDALAEATTVRDNERAEFNANDKDNLLAISSLKNAVSVLKKHFNFLQATDQHKALKKIALVVSYTMHAHKKSLTGITAKERGVVSSLLQNKYTPASGEIFGILNQMLEQFVANQKSTTEEEAQAEADFEEMRDAKNNEIAQMSQQQAEKEGMNGDSAAALSEAQASRDDLRGVMGADSDFVQELEDKCQANTDNYNQRSKDRATELNGVNQAIEILSGDDATANFAKTGANSFIQTRQTKSVRAIVDHALAVLKPHKGLSFLRVTLANTLGKTGTDALSIVTAKFKEHIEDLEAAQAEEKALKKDCVQQIHDNDSRLEETQRNRDDLANKISALESAIEENKANIKDTVAQLDDNKVEISRAGDNRARAHDEYAVAVADHRMTINTIDKALDVLKKVYEKDAFLDQTVRRARATNEAFLGVHQPSDMGNYKSKGQAGNKVLSMLRDVQNETKIALKALHSEEARDQADYEAFTTGLNKESSNLLEFKASEETTKASNEEDLNQAEVEHRNAESDIAAIQDALKNIHDKCDFFIENFETRQDARLTEIEAIKEAIGIIEASQFDAQDNPQQ